MCLKSTYFNQNKSSFQVEASKVSKFCRLALILHGGSDEQPVFKAVGQTSDFFPLLSWQMIPSGMLSYTVNMKMRPKLAQGLLFNMFNEWVSLQVTASFMAYLVPVLIFLYFIRFIMDVENEIPPLYESFASLHTKTLNMSGYGVGCWELISSFYGMYKIPL